MFNVLTMVTIVSLNCGKMKHEPCAENKNGFDTEKFEIFVENRDRKIRYLTGEQKEKKIKFCKMRIISLSKRLMVILRVKKGKRMMSWNGCWM